MKKTQQQIILELLMTTPRVNSHDLTYEYGIKQAPTRVNELRDQGYDIISSPLLKNRSVDYSLVPSPLSPKKPLESQPGGADYMIIGDTAYPKERKPEQLKL